MANPKRRHSHSRSRKRRTHKGLEVVQLSYCRQCKQAVLPHVICANCGYYKGRIVEAPKDESKPASR